MIKNFFKRIFNISDDIAIDLGTANTLIYIKSKGVVLDEPSVVAVKRHNNKLKIVAIGHAAKEMVGRTPEGIEAIRPMKDGVIADFEIAEKMIEYFLKQVIKGSIFKPRVLVCVPSGATLVERRAIQEAVDNAGAGEVYLIEEPMAAAIGAGVDIDKPEGSMIVDIGGGTTEIAVISLGGIVKSSSLKVGGDKMDLNIAQYIRNNFKLSIGPNTAEKIKKEVASFMEPDAHIKSQKTAIENKKGVKKTLIKTEKQSEVEVKPSEVAEIIETEKANIDVGGRYLINGIPSKVKISPDQILSSIEDSISEIIFGIRKILEVTPAELSSDIFETGVILTGGGALIKGIDKKISKETGLKVKVAESPLYCVVKGTGIALEELDNDEKYIKYNPRR